MDITQLLAFSVKNKASDLHLSSGLPPMIRVHGDVRRINVEPLEHKQVHEMVYDIMNDSQRKAYEETLECDFSFEIQGLARFRVNAFNQNRGAGAVVAALQQLVDGAAGQRRVGQHAQVLGDRQAVGAGDRQAAFADQRGGGGAHGAHCIMRRACR